MELADPSRPARRAWPMRLPHRAWSRRRQGLPVSFEQSSKVFRFGAEEALAPNYVATLPIGLAGRNACARFHSVQDLDRS